MDDRTRRRDGGIAERAGAAVWPALPLAYGGTVWLQLLHRAEGAHEHGEPGLAAHLLRDATLALPAIVLAVALALAAAGALLSRAGRDAGGRLASAVTAAMLAVATSGVFALTGPIHGSLFGAEHGGHELPVAVHLARDFSLALVGQLAIAGAIAAAARCARLVAAAARVRPHALRLAAPAAVAVAVAAPVGLVFAQGVDSATADAGVGTPCPTDAPVKRFSVRALDVDIPLNRFGDHDPAGKMYALAEEVLAVRAQERSQQVSVGLRDDAIQPLVIRANLGDCVEIDYVNQATGGEYGLHIDGIAHGAASSGDAVGQNVSSAAPAGTPRTYRFYVPQDPELEGTHYIRPGPGYRDAVSHGLFGALSVEPAGSVYLHPDTGMPLRSGWEAIIAPQDGASFREYVKVYHEIGDENAAIFGKDNRELPTVDPITDAYRPGSRGINYRSEPFMNRLERNHDRKASSYNSYTFGDPATPTMRAYVSDPTKIRILHAGSEMFHVYHLHGGGIRWPQNPSAVHGWDYAKVGLNKNPKVGGTNRLDSQSFGPGESYTLEIEGGAGGVQQAVGDLLEHCHIAEHYVAGMWSFWRVFNTRQVDLLPLPDRAAPPRPVDSAGLIGRTMPDGTTLTKDNLDAWIRELIPPQGEPKDADDATVWDWTVDRSDAARPVYLGEPEETEAWPNLPRVVPGHPSALPGDEFVDDRPKILFNPVDGRISYPLLRPHIGQRPPLPGNGHSGTPFLGATAGAAARREADPWARRADGLCPQGASVRRFNLTSIQLPIPVTRGGGTDPTGKIFVLNRDKAAVLSGDKPAEPLAIRANIGDCVALTLVTELERTDPAAPMPQSNMHIHHVQFDPQGSDGASAGMVYDQSVEPYKLVDPRMTAAAHAGDTTLALEDVAKFRPGVAIGVGLGTEDIEIREVVTVDRDTSTVTLDRALGADHAAGQWAGTEFVQERWYPDVDLDNVFWHDHVDGIHGWGKGMVGQLIVEPKGSTYHDPRTGQEVASGTYVDIRTPNPLAPGLVDGSFRELALWTIDENPVTDATINLRAEPWADRLARDRDASLLFSSWRHGDPNTPLPRAYRGDPFVFRTVNVSGNGIDSLQLAGHRFYTEYHRRGADGSVLATPKDSVQYGVSERFTGILEGGAGGTGRRAGDYVYKNGVARRFRQGAWGLLRVLPSRRDDLQPLPGTSVPDGGAATDPQPTGSRPPAVATAGRPCPAGAPERTFAISAVDLPAGADGARSAFVPTADADAVRAGRLAPEPLALHAAAGECVTVEFTNARTPDAGGATPRASFSVAKLDRTAESSGVNAGFGPEQTVAPGETRLYRYHVDAAHIGSAVIADFGGLDTGTRGLYGAFVVAPAGAQFSDPRTGLPRDVGTQVDVKVPGQPAYRDYSLMLFDDDAQIGANTMPYPTAVAGPALVNYRSEPRGDGPTAFSSRANGDPSTPVLRAHVGDPVRVHVLGAPGSEQPHAFSLGGLAWHVDPALPASNVVSTTAVAPWVTQDIEVLGGAGGQGRMVGDFWYGDLRRPFAQAGMWGLVRVLPEDSTEVRPLGARSVPVPEPPSTPAPADPAPSAPDFETVPPAPSGDQPPAGTTTPTPVVTTPSTPAPPREARATALRGLVAARHMRLGAVRSRGIAFELAVPKGTRALALRLVPKVRGKGAATITTTVRVRAGSGVRVVWRLDAAARQRLRAGRYTLEVRAAGGGAPLRRVVTIGAGAP